MAAYESDFYGWTQEQVRLLQAGAYPQVDVDHLLEEIESMGRAERRRLVHQLTMLLVHLLKWRHQPEFRSRSWELTIADHRRHIARLLRDNASLNSHLTAAVAEAYEDAVSGVVRETGLPEATFPVACPYTVEDLTVPPAAPPLVLAERPAVVYQVGAAALPPPRELEAYFDFSDPAEIRIQGHRIWLEHVLFEHLEGGMAPAQLAERFPTLRLDEIYAVLLYYYRHRPALDRYLAAWIEWGDRMRAEQASNPAPIDHKLRALLAQ